MIGIILTGHGNFATGIYSSLKLIAGARENLECCDFVEGMGADEDLVPNLQAAMDKLSPVCDGIVFLTDLKGGSPFQKAVTLSFGKDNMKVIAGTNLPMLLEAAMICEFSTDVDTFVEGIINTGKEQVCKFVFEKRQVDEESDGGI